MSFVLLLSNMGPSEENPNSGRFVVNQYKALKKLSNFEIDYFYLNQDKKSGFNSLLRYPLFLLSFIKKFVFSTKRVDLIHVHFYFPNILLAICYKWLRNPWVKIVVTFHGSDIYKYQYPGMLYKLATYFVSHFIFVSPLLKKRFFLSDVGEVLCAGASDLFYSNRPDTVAPEYDCVFVGSLDHNKGIDRLVEFLKNNQELRVAIVGAGPLLAKLKGLDGENVKILGSLEPHILRGVYQKSKCLINLSRTESFGLVITEALACGVPAVATNTDGANSQIEHGSNGYIIKNGSDYSNSELEQRIFEILSLSKSEYSNLSEQSRRSVQEYKLSHVIESIDKIYNRLLKV